MMAAPAANADHVNPSSGRRYCLSSTSAEKGASYPGLEIIAKLATVLEVEPVELLRLPKPVRLRGDR
jgi:hypothetical protein